MVVQQLPRPKCGLLVFEESEIKTGQNLRRRKHKSPSVTLLEAADELRQFCLEVKSPRQPPGPIWSSSSSSNGCQAVFDSHEVLTWELIHHYLRPLLTQLPTTQTSAW